jgi:hypothetical protein
MWPPLNKNELPSPEEIRHAKEVIGTLENALRDAFKLKSTKLRIAEMQRDLHERKCWIAPIRKVPTEVLTDILLFTSEMDDLAPVKFSAVNRLWRNIILATPRAWSFIHLRRQYDKHIHRRNDGHYFSSYKTTYFQRSKPRLLHLCLPDVEGFYPTLSISIIKEQAHRIQCLTTSAYVLSTTRSALECELFPYLQTLTVADQGAGIKLDTSFFSVSKFPALQILRWPRCSPSTNTSPTISPSFFPPLQHLSLSVVVTSSMDILQSCAATLKSLDISYDRRSTSTTQISFPVLRFLTIRSNSSFEGRPPLVKAITPILASLEVLSLSQLIPVFFDADLQKVTHMRWYTFNKPSLCTAQVRVLQIVVKPDNITPRTGGYAECANMLKEIACAYPSLERIELSGQTEGPDGIGLMQRKVEACLGGMVRKAQVIVDKRLERGFAR